MFKTQIMKKVIERIVGWLESSATVEVRGSIMVKGNFHQEVELTDSKRVTYGRKDLAISSKIRRGKPNFKSKMES